MLVRPGSKPGPAWMRNMSDALSNPDRTRGVMLPFWAFFILYMVACIGLTHFITAVAFAKDHVYESQLHLAGIPLLSYGSVAHGIIAIGARATGIIALGGIAVGVFAFGGVAFGGVAVSVVSIGLFSFGVTALGWRALGGVAVGESALGGLAVGRHAFAGNGVAYGSVEASGRQKEHLIG